MEYMMVVCVGLDTVMDDEESNMLEARSMLYRAITRAVMMAMAVNHVIPGGWFSFLRQIRMREGAKLDEQKALKDAEMADTKIEAAAHRLRDAQYQAGRMLRYGSKL